VAKSVRSINARRNKAAGINKALFIREAFEALKDLEAPAKAVLAHIAEHHKDAGVVSPAQISNIRTKLRDAKKPKKAGKRGSNCEQVTEAELVGAKKLADTVGGVERAKVLLEILVKLK